jgi:hypothetical protein
LSVAASAGASTARPWRLASASRPRSPSRRRPRGHKRVERIVATRLPRQRLRRGEGRSCQRAAPRCLSAASYVSALHVAWRGTRQRRTRASRRRRHRFAVHAGASGPLFLAEVRASRRGRCAGGAQGGAGRGPRRGTTTLPQRPTPGTTIRARRSGRAEAQQNARPEGWTSPARAGAPGTAHQRVRRPNPTAV